jgi:hypothetical protein
MEPVQSCSAGGFGFSVGAGGRLKQRQKSRRDAAATEADTAARGAGVAVEFAGARPSGFEGRGSLRNLLAVDDAEL